MEKTRINKFLAQAGICSRREADKLIETGKVTINGKKAQLGTAVSEKDHIKLNGKLISEKEKKVYIAFHKPFGVITTTNPESTNNIMEYFKIPERIYPIGRLDVQSSGLILLTNDGAIVNRLLKAENKQEKEYIVTVNKPLTDEAIEKLEKGIMLDRRKTLPAKVKKRSTHQMSITIVQGINRQIRRMCEALGYDVKILKRTRIASIELKDLQRGKWRYLSDKEIRTLKG